MAAQSSAVADAEPIEVLFVLHNKFDLMDFAGPAEVLSSALHDLKDKTSKAFEITLAAAEPRALSDAGVIIGAQVGWKEAHERLKEFDVLIVLGGNSEAVLNEKAEPLDLIAAFAELQRADPTRERTVLSVCTGSLFLAEKGILAGLSATTHTDYITRLEILCSNATTRDLAERTDVLESARYVVNNLRFDLGDEEENPYIRRKSDARRASNARKGSMSWKNSNTRRESVARRAAMRLGGLRVITSAGVSAGVDAALYLVSAMVSEESATEAARVMQWTWNKGIVVDGLDV